jgi:hypothetical protein
MSGFLVFAALSQWNVTVLSDSQGVQDLFLRDGQWPVVVGGKKFYRYEGTWPWTSKPLPDSFAAFGDFALDGSGRLHYAQVGGGGTAILEYVENGSGWDLYTYPDGGFISCTEGYPSVAIETYLSGDTSYFAYAYESGLNIFCLIREGSSFQKDTVPINANLFSPDIQLDSLGNPWIICHENNIPLARTFCAHYDGAWAWESLGYTTTFFFTSGPFLAMRGTAYALYKPTGVLKQEDDTLRFAWRRPDGVWHVEKMGEFQIRGLCFTPDDRIHGLAAFPDSIAYHVVRDTASSKWDTLEVVDSVNGIKWPQFSKNWGGGYMLVDVNGYLHAAYNGRNGKLCYATTNPDIRITESPPEPGPVLILIPTSRGFYITGYSGQARIYDPAGRLILEKEIKGKTLISPLRPGVYFVVAGRERARVTVR